MEFLHKAKYVRLKSHHRKFLHANSDQKTVFQHRHGTCKNAKWTVEFTEGIDINVVRLKSCYGKYLTATDEPFLLGVTGLKVIQNLPIKLDSSIEWEPIKVSSLVKLQTSHGKYLRANGGLPPYRNSITHDVPYRHQDWILWEVDIIELFPEPPKNISQSESIHDELEHPKNISHSKSLHDDLEHPKNISHSKSLLDDLEPPKIISKSGSLHDDLESPKSISQQPESLDDDLNSSFRLTFSRRSSNIVPRLDTSKSKSKSEGRVIYYYVADENGNVNDTVEGPSFQFKKQGLKELTQKLEEETGLNNVTLCLRNKLNGKLHPLRLELPPNNATMHVVVMPSSF